jgi:hypothetical protein
MKKIASDLRSSGLVPMCFPKTSVMNYHSTLRKIIPEKRGSHLHRGDNLKSHIFTIYDFDGVVQLHLLLYVMVLTENG